jgi:hypothetical protein
MPEPESVFATKTKVRLAKGGVWLEAEISPRALLAALPSCDRNADHRLDEVELSQSRGEILSYFAAKVKLEAEGKALRADSTYFAFRSPASVAAVPDRFYIYHWYAILRQPSRLLVGNELFCELRKDCRHLGAIVSGEQVLNFELTHETEEAATANAKGFQITSTGEATPIVAGDHTLQAGYVWAGLGLFGFVFFRLASVARNKWSRAKEEEEDEEEAEMSLTECAVRN